MGITMSMPQVPHRFRLSTDQIPARDRLELCREELLRRNMDAEFIDRSPTGLRFELDVQNFGAVTAAFIRGTPASFLRTRSHLADGRDIVSMIIHRTGQYRLEAPRYGIDAPHDGAAIMSSRHEVSFHSLQEGGSGWSLCLERKVLEPMLTGVEEPLLRCVPRNTPALRLLTGYLETLFDLDVPCDRALSAMHIGDLVASALGVTGEAQALVRDRGVGAARQCAVLDHITKHAAEPDLDPARVAQHLGMSVRYLHRLLEPTGRSFSEHLLGQRLDRAAAMLRDPRFTGIKIAEIAEKTGFSDISHFNRSFRRKFGDTPLGVRVRTQRKTSTS
jgi:AraC-like DNA-binding protein